MKLAARTGTIRTLDAGKITLGEFAEKRWGEYVKTRLATSTVHTYAKAWNLHVLPHLGDMPLRKLTLRRTDPPIRHLSNFIARSCVYRALSTASLFVLVRRRRPAGISVDPGASVAFARCWTEAGLERPCPELVAEFNVSKPPGRFVREN